MRGFNVILSICVFLNLCGIISSAYCPTQYLNANSITSKILSSPNYPFNYALSTTCYWRITAPPGYLVQLRFTDFNTYKYYSGTCSSYSSHSLYIYDSYSTSSSKLLGVYCGNNVPANVVSTGIYLYLKFQVSSSYYTRKGFSLTYSAVSNLPDDSTICSQFNSYNTNNNIRLTPSTSSYKEIKSPLYPNKYPSNIQCTWYITASSSSKRIQLTYTNTSIFSSASASSSCSSLKDILTIYDASYHSSTRKLKTICSKSSWSTPISLISTSKYMTIHFKTDSDNYFVGTTAGFLLKYKEIDQSSVAESSLCSPAKSYSANNNLRLTASSSSKYIRSPWYPSQYPTNIQCTWYISASSSSKRIQLTLTDAKIYNQYSYSCSAYSYGKDTLSIRDGSSPYSKELKTVCSRLYSSTTVKSTGRYITIRFKTDSTNYFTSSTAGFELKYHEYEDSTSVGTFVGIFVAIAAVVGVCLIVYCKHKRNRSAGQVQVPVAATIQSTTTQSTTTTTHAPPQPASQYPMQTQGGFPAQSSYPPPGQGSYPPPGQGSYPPPTQGSYPPTQGSYPPPAQGSYPPPGQGSYPPPTQGSYPPPAQGSYPPAQGGYPPPVQGNYPLQGGYPPVSYLPPVDDPIPNEPPPMYPGPSTTLESAPPFNPQYPGASQSNPPYPPGTGNPPPYPATQDTKFGGPPQF